MAVEASLAVELKQAGVDAAVDDKDIFHRIPCRFDAADGGSARVHDERHRALPASQKVGEQLERHHRVLAAPDGDQVVCLIEGLRV